MTLPIIWLLGLLPPFEVLLLWIIEQTQIIIFGGTSSVNLWKTFIQFGISVIQTVIVVFLTNDIKVIIIIGGVTGYLLSLDMGITGIYNQENSNQNQPIRTLNNAKKNRAGLSFQNSKTFRIFREIITHLFFLTLNILVVIFLPNPDDEKNQVNNSDEEQKDNLQKINQTFNNKNNNLSVIQAKIFDQMDYLGWTIIMIYLTLILTNELQKVYCCLGLIRSPFYKICTKGQLYIAIWHHFRSLFFNFLSCLIMTYYLKLSITQDPNYYQLNNYQIITHNYVGIWTSLEVIAILRCFRWVWQNSEASLMDLSILQLIISLTKLYGWQIHFSRPIQLICIAYLRDRLHQIFEKLYLTVSLAVSALEDKASRRSYAGCLFQLNLILFPIVLSVIIISSIVSAPILSAFTLPLYFVAYPRQLRFWPNR